MALTQTQVEHPIHAEHPMPERQNPSSPARLSNSNLPRHSIHSTKSWQSIRSLRDIPYVETSFDYNHDSTLGDRGSNLSSFIATPIHPGRIETSSPASLGISESPFSKDGGSEASAIITVSALQYPNGEYENELMNLEKELSLSHIQLAAGLQDQPPLPNIHPESTVPSDTREQISEQDSFMETISKAASMITTMKDNITTWAPTAHALVVTAAALQRDNAAFAATLRTMLSSHNGLMQDPNGFTSQYYQLREAYTMLLSSTNFSNTSGLYSPNHTSSIPAKHHNGDTLDETAAESAWDDRQLVDSFMTLLRTSPGFIVSAIEEMTEFELTTFCADVDGSALSVFFHGILGASAHFRPKLLAQIVILLSTQHQHSRSIAKLNELVRGLLRELLRLSLGTLSSGSSVKLERFLRGALLNEPRYEDFAFILGSCIPTECLSFLEDILGNEKLDISTVMSTPSPLASTRAQIVALEILNIVTESLTDFTKQLLTNPHLFDIITDVYIGDKHKAVLDTLCSDIRPYVSSFIQELTSRNQVHTGVNAKGATTSTENETLWQADELIAIKGSDIILMFNALLPYRTPIRTTGNDSTANTTGTFTNEEEEEEEEEEWCLESIRNDLVPVMQGLSHSTLIHSDGWQIFKIGEDGLVTDLGNDMGLSVHDTDVVNRTMEAICAAVSQYNFKSLAERIEASKRDAELRGDFFTLLSLKNAGEVLDASHVDVVNRQCDLTKYRMHILRRTLDNAARELSFERQRLFKLISIMDTARVHMWYGTEARLGSPFNKSREFLRVLYPREDMSAMETYNFNYHSETISANVANSAVTSTAKSRRLSILSTHSVPESPFFFKESLASLKLNDKEVEKVFVFMRHNRVRNAINAEERFHRGLIEIASLAHKLLDRDHLASYVTFKRDRHFQNQYSQQQSTSGLSNTLKRNSQRNRRSSLGLFDFFDNGNSSQQNIPVTLHSATSSQLLGLSSSHESLRRVSRPTLKPSSDGRASRANSGHQSISDNHSSSTNHHGTNNVSSINSFARHTISATDCAPVTAGPPKWPTIHQVQAIILSDIGQDFLHFGTETDKFMEQTGRMVLGGDGTLYLPILEEISMANSPEDKLKLFEYLFRYARCIVQQQRMRVSRSDIIHELSRAFGREPGTLFRDLQIVSSLVNPTTLDSSYFFDDVLESASIVLNLVVVKSMDYATRFLRYFMESSSLNEAPRMVMTGIKDAVHIWEFCAKTGNRDAQRKLSELYSTFKHVPVDLMPLSKPSILLEGIDHSGFRDAVIGHWLNVASRI